ncbi:MAG: methyltransferase domain-containing protein [Deltaproteobacteria bacterium]|nr:methyltransferase domain-containing protein [Deltaproteobacteria bacterium]
MAGFTIEAVRAHWDAVGDEYDNSNDRVRRIHHQRFRKAIDLWNIHGRHLDGIRPLRILNVWSRTGEALPYLRKRMPDAEIANLEASEVMIGISRKKFPLESFGMTDLTPETMRFREPFHFLLSLETLEHSPDPKAFLSGLFRALRPEGILILSAPTAVMELPQRLYERATADHGEGPHRFYFSWEVKRMLAAAGFRLREHQGTLFLPVECGALLSLAERIAPAMNALGLSDLGLRQFYVAGK